MEAVYRDYIPFSMRWPKFKDVDDIYTAKDHHLAELCQEANEAFLEDYLYATISRIYKLIKSLVSGVFSAMKDLTKRFMATDYLLKRRLDGYTNQLQGLMKTVTTEQKVQANAYFLGYATEKMPSLAVLYAQIRAFTQAAKDVGTIAKRCMQDDGSIQREITISQMFSTGSISAYDSIGIEITENAIIYTNVYLSYPNSTYQQLGFISLDTIHEFTNNYERNVFKELRVIWEITRELERYHKKLENEYGSLGTADTETLTEESKKILMTKLHNVRIILPAVRKFSGCLLAIHRQLAQRRKDILGAGLRALVKVLPKKEDA